jgi:DNA-binding FadR family transcriptional regulator
MGSLPTSHHARGAARAAGGSANRGAPSRRPTKAAESLARRIEAEIVQRGWPVGELLGTEPELVERYGVSRPVLREAVRLLEHHMVAAMRRGAGGGLRVTAPDPSAVTTAAALYLDYRGVRVSQLYAARITLESRCVELTTDRLTEKGAERLEAVTEVLRGLDVVAMVDHSHDVEMAIAELSGDPVLTLFVEVLLRIAQQHLVPPEERPGRANDIEQMRRAQLRVVDAILARDAAKARERLVRYLEAAASSARRRFILAATAGSLPSAPAARGHRRDAAG